MDAAYPSLEGRPVLISGGGSGIGSSIVEHFCRQGAHVAFLEIDGEAASRTAAETEAATGNRPSFAICDLRDVQATQDAVRALVAEAGAFRVLINNAGNDERHEWQSVSQALWDDRIAVNLRHQFFVAQVVAGPMGAAGGGSIVNLGSISWMLGGLDLIAYTTAKAGVQGFTKSLARELGTMAIRVNCIAPGWVLTPRQVARVNSTAPWKFAQHLERQSLKEHLVPADVARMALWLAADEAPPACARGRHSSSMAVSFWVSRERYRYLPLPAWRSLGPTLAILADIPAPIPPHFP